MTLAIYLAAYDVSSPSRLRRVGKCVKAWKAAGQKSAAECWLEPRQRDFLMARVDAIIDRSQDKFHMFRMDPRQEPLLFGTARPTKPGLFIIS